MIKHKHKIQIEIWGYEVETTASYPDDTEAGWWKFEYSVVTDGKKKKYGELDGTWNNQKKKNFSAVLQRGYALKLILESLI